MNRRNFIKTACATVAITSSAPYLREDKNQISSWALIPDNGRDFETLRKNAIWMRSHYLNSLKRKRLYPEDVRFCIEHPKETTTIHIDRHCCAILSYEAQVRPLRIYEFHDEDLFTRIYMDGFYRTLRL